MKSFHFSVSFPLFPPPVVAVTITGQKHQFVDGDMYVYVIIIRELRSQIYLRPSQFLEERNFSRLHEQIFHFSFQSSC